ncbi:MAG: lipoyl synthase [Myxococcales bacterium]|nr:lipoyl synthase [Myxococcales bacterium]
MTPPPDRPRKPEWLRVRLPGGEAQARFAEVRERFHARDLHTVCEEARCPNIFECWGQGTATIMILGETCTRGCKFCSVKSGNPGGYVDPREPEKTALSLKEMGLGYVVMTMVDRDDLLDGGARHIVRTIERIRHHCPDLRVETLLGDFQGVRRDVETVVREGAPDVYAHNVEVVPRLQKTIRDPRCSWERSIDVLKWAKAAGSPVTKSSLMLGLGETRDEVLDAMCGLRAADVDVLTIGQYLQPNARLAPVVRYVPPDEFAELKERALELGFAFVASGPLVRSSYRAAEAFLSGVLDARDGERSTGGPAGVDRYGRKEPASVVS